MVNSSKTTHRISWSFWISTILAFILLGLGFQAASQSVSPAKPDFIELSLLSKNNGSAGFRPTSEGPDEVTWLAGFQPSELSSIRAYSVEIDLNGMRNGENTVSPLALRVLRSIAPPSWKVEYQAAAGDPWLTTPPTTGVTKARFTYQLAEKPPVFQAVNFSSTGDGYHPMSYISPQADGDALVFVVNHHTSYNPVQCRRRLDSTKACPGFPQDESGNPTGGLPILTTNGITLKGPNSSNVYTPSGMLFSHMDNATGKLYIPGVVITPASGVKLNDIGITCLDFSKLPYRSCGFTKLANTYSPSFGVYQWSYIAGLAVSGNKIFMTDATGSLYCYNTFAAKLCQETDPGNYSFGLNSAYATSSKQLITIGEVSSVSDSGYIFASGQYVTNGKRFLACFDTINNRPCSGSWPIDLSTGGGADGTAPVITSASNVIPIPNSSGTLAGVCTRGRPDKINQDNGNRAVWNSDGVRSNTKGLACYTLTGADLQVPKIFFDYAAAWSNEGNTEIINAFGLELRRWWWTGLANPWENMFTSARHKSKVYGSTQVWDNSIALRTIGGVNGQPSYNDFKFLNPAIKDAIWCVDIATGAACAEPNNQFPIYIGEKNSGGEHMNQSRPYVIKADNTRADCLWILGDLSVGYPFEALDGRICSDRSVEFRIETDPRSYYGFDNTLESIPKYSKIVLENVEWGKEIWDDPQGIEITFIDRKTDLPIKTIFMPQGDLSIDVPSDITFTKYPSITTLVKITRPKSNPPPAFNDKAKVDLLWNGPPIQLGVTTQLNALSNIENMCLLEGKTRPYSSDAVPTPRPADVTGNVLVQKTPSKNDALQPIITNRFALKTDSAAGSTDASKAISLILRPTYNQSDYSGQIELKGLVPNKSTELNIGSSGITQDSVQSFDKRNVVSISSEGESTEFKWSKLDSDTQKTLNSDKSLQVDSRGEDRVNYIRGQRIYETGYAPAPAGADSRPQIFRRRPNIDATAASALHTPSIGPIYNGGLALLDPISNGYYTGTATGYADYIAKKSRTQPVAIVASNDGMVHGFRVNGEQGKASSISLSETFAYVPRALTPRIPGLTERNATQLLVNSYYLDGVPTVADVKVNNAWSSVTVVPFGQSVRGLMALNITNSDQSSSDIALWEFTDADHEDMGYLTNQPATHPRNPSISAQTARICKSWNSDKTKCASEEWVYVTGNGYNSRSGAASLFLLNFSNTTKGSPRFDRIQATASGSNNGLSTPLLISNAQGYLRYAFAGDVKGTIWRFDFSSSPYKAEKVFTRPASIIGAPALVQTDTGPMLIFATGKPQISQLRAERNGSNYGIYGLNMKEFTRAPTTPLDSLHAQIGGAIQTAIGAFTGISVTSGVTEGRTTRTLTSPLISEAGWYVPLDSGEMVLGNIFAHASNNEIIVTAIRSPSATAGGGDICDAGESLQYRISPSTGAGKAVSNAPKPGLNSQRISRGAPPNAQGQLPIGGVRGVPELKHGKSESTQKLDNAHYSGRLWWREL